MMVGPSWPPEGVLGGWTDAVAGFSLGRRGVVTSRGALAGTLGRELAIPPGVKAPIPLDSKGVWEGTIFPSAG